MINKLKSIYDGLYDCGKKITSATTFTDFFVHDILDYTILNKEESNFIPNENIFDIRNAINQIYEILEDKMEMKNIEVNIEDKGFDKDDYIIKSD